MAAWLQQQGYVTSLFDIAEDDAENAKTTMSQPGSVPPRAADVSPVPPSDPSPGRPQAGQLSSPSNSSQHLPLQLQRLPLDGLQDVLSALRTLKKSGISSIEDIAALETVVAQKVAEKTPEKVAKKPEEDLESLSMEELRQRAEAAGAPTTMLSFAEKKDLIEFLSM
jgi:hypothetical protein